MVCSITRGPANSSSAPGSASMTSANVAKLASTPPVVGWVSTEMNGKEWSASISSATTVFAICIRERIPSCMRAPPEAVTTTRGTASSMAAPTSWQKRSPTTEPMEPPRKRKSMTPQRNAPAAEAAETGEHRLRQPGFELRFGKPIHIRAAVIEVEGIRRLKVARHLPPGAGIGKLRDSYGCIQREMVPAMGTHAERRLELFRGHGRVALRAARSQCFRRTFGSRRFLRSDLDSDLLVHWPGSSS